MYTLLFENDVLISHFNPTQYFIIMYVLFIVLRYRNTFKDERRSR